MIRKAVVWVVCCAVLVSSLAPPALADQSLGFRRYFQLGVKAFKSHDDQKALRFFEIAQIYDPLDVTIQRWILYLLRKGVRLPGMVSRLPPERSIGFRYYFAGGVAAFQAHNDEKAIRYFRIALIFYPGSRESVQYLKVLYRRQGLGFYPEASGPGQAPALAGKPQPAPVQEQATLVQPLPTQQTVIQPPTPVQPQASPSQPQAAPQVPSEIATPKESAIYAAPVKGQKTPVLIDIAQLSSLPKAVLQIPINTTVILEGHNIQNFLVIDQGFITAKVTDPGHLEIDAVRIGTTFLHVWDNTGRHTFYVEVVFPKYNPPPGPQLEKNGVYHSQPFVFTYSNDWDTYYSGKNLSQITKQSNQFTESLGVTGQTPYGFFDASGSYIDFDGFTQFNTYTIGLSQIPLEGTDNFNLRGFDTTRYLSPLTMPGTQLRGVFADVDLMHDMIGISVSHGQEEVPPGFLSVNASQYNDSYIDAAKIVLFPKNPNDQYAVNIATGYGSDRPYYLADHVYSVQGEHKFNDFLTLSAEQGTDTDHQSTLASLDYKKLNFDSNFSFRDIDKDYSTISTLPANQGEVGATWVTDGQFARYTEDTYLEAYRDRLEPNPDHPHAYNVDGNGQLHVNLTPNVWSDSNINFVDTPGELSPSRSVGASERVSRNFGLWNNLKGTVFAGAGYQDVHSTGSDISDYSREDVTAGVQVPLTTHFSTYANYEFDSLDQPDFGHSTPSVINTGIQYQKQLSKKFSFNTQLDYHDELGVKNGNDTFLSGEESIILTSGFNYTPTPDVNIFADVNASHVIFHVTNPSYDDFEAHVGMRIVFGTNSYWDPLGTVTGIVFKDRKGDGTYAAGDEGIADVKIKVGDKQAVTDKNGRYSVQIHGQAVDVVPVLDTVPGGLLFSTPQSLHVKIMQGRKSRADFGLISQTGIYGIVFLSKNGSNSPNEGDQFIGKVFVILDGKIRQRSDMHGAFYFRNVEPGEHTLTIDLNSLELNMVPLVKLENKINVAEGANYMFNIPVKVQKAQNQ